MATTITLSELLDRDVELTCADAVAIVQLLISEPDIASARAPYGPPSLENIALSGSGSVYCLHTAATPTLIEAALLLQALVVRTIDRVPGGLRYAIGRALLEVEAPPFDTLEDFSAALTRFESGARAERVSQLTRATSDTCTRVAPVPTRTDRRRHEPTPAELRRQLREADLRLYDAHQQRAASGSGKAVRSRRIRRAPIAACMAAGIALVAVGELSPSTRARFAAIRNLPQPVPAPSSRPVAASPADQTLPAEAVVIREPIAVPPVTAIRLGDGSPAPVRRGTRPATRTRPSAQSKRAVVAQNLEDSRSTKRSPQDDRDKGVIARIRFEWNNPFH